MLRDNPGLDGWWHLTRLLVWVLLYVLYDPSKSSITDRLTGFAITYLSRNRSKYSFDSTQRGIRFISMHVAANRMSVIV